MNTWNSQAFKNLKTISVFDKADDDGSRSINEIYQNINKTTLEAINLLLCTYENIMLDEHILQFKEYRNLLEKFMDAELKLSKFGEHYATLCLWACDEATSGPDTCECISMKRKFDNIFKLITFYNRFINAFQKN